MQQRRIGLSIPQAGIGYPARLHDHPLSLTNTVLKIGLDDVLGAPALFMDPFDVARFLTRLPQSDAACQLVSACVLPTLFLTAFLAVVSL